MAPVAVCFGLPRMYNLIRRSVYLSTKRDQTEWPVYLVFVRRSQRQQTILDGDGAGAAEASSSCWLRFKRLTRTDHLHCRLWLTSV